MVGFGTVNRVEGLLALSPPTVVIQLDGRTSTSKTILRLRNAKNVKLLQIDTARTFLYRMSSCSGSAVSLCGPPHRWLITSLNIEVTLFVRAMRSSVHPVRQPSGRGKSR